MELITPDRPPSVPFPVAEPLSSMPRSMMAASLVRDDTNNGDDMSHIHAIVWLDHLNARVIGFSLGKSEVIEVHSQSPHRQIHRKSGIPGSGHAADDLDFFDEVAEAVHDVRELLITGPGTAKVAFEKYIRDRHPDVAQRIVGVETLDHPSDGELLAYARKYFKRFDQLGYG
jgi:stalled ribosome rescue protein Dom34